MPDISINVSSTAAVFDEIARALDEFTGGREAAVQVLLVLACRPQQGSIAIAARHVLAKRVGVAVKWRGPKNGWEISGRLLGT